MRPYSDRRYGTLRWRRVRAYVLERDSVRCHWCGGRASTADHLHAVADGGPFYDTSNLVAACVTCNSRRGGETGRERALRRRDRACVTRWEGRTDQAGSAATFGRRKRWADTPGQFPSKVADRTPDAADVDDTGPGTPIGVGTRRIWPGAL